VFSKVRGNRSLPPPIESKNWVKNNPPGSLNTIISDKMTRDKFPKKKQKLLHCEKVVGMVYTKASQLHRGVEANPV